jgi:DNA-binding GntR family transcriptional regulator
VDLTELRCEIETIALRRSIELGDINWEAGLLAAAHRLRATPERLAGKKGGVNPEWVAAHAGFHAALIAACGSVRLRALHAHLYEQAERYRLLSNRIDASRDVPGEHQEILDLALKRDARRLIEAMLRHLRGTTQLIVEGSGKRPSRRSSKLNC